MIDVNQVRKEAVEYARAAINFESEKEWESAFDSYVKSIEKLKLLKNNDTNKYNQETYHKKAIEYFEKASTIKKTYLSKGIKSNKEESGSSNNTANNSNTNNNSKPSNTSKTNNNKADDKPEEVDEETKKLQEALASCMVTEKPNVKWDDVAGLEKAKEALKEAVILPLKFKHLFNEKRRPWKGILLYGPPGTGKSYIAKACATEVNGTFYSVSASNIMSKWVGEAERTVRALFDLARQNKPAVIFLDEIDSLLSARGDGEQESTRRVKTEFLVQMQGVGKDDTGILVLGATNIPWSLDPAVRRRFQKKIYISLPEHEARYKMLEMSIGKTPHTLTEVDMNEIAELTNGYSGSDIATLSQEAIYEPLRKCQLANYFKKINGKYYVAEGNEKDAIKMTLTDIPQPEFLVPPEVTKDDFIKAFTRIRATVSKKDLEQQDKFTEEFGQEG